MTDDKRIKVGRSLGCPVEYRTLGSTDVFKLPTTPDITPAQLSRMLKAIGIDARRADAKGIANPDGTTTIVVTQ